MQLLFLVFKFTNKLREREAIWAFNKKMNVMK